MKGYDYYKDYYEEEEKSKFAYILPIIFILTIIPLIVRLKVIDLDYITQKFWVGSENNLDFFSYYKSVYVILVSLVLMCILFYKIYENGVQYILKSKYYIFIGVYTIFIILSTIASKYSKLALYGYPDRYEGMFTWIAYMIICFISINLVRTNKQIKLLMISLLLGATVISIIGLFQFLNLDIWKTDLGKFLMLPQQYMKVKNELIFKLEPRTIYSTLSHYNYVGSYISIVFPMALTLLLLVKERKAKIALAFLNLLFIIIWMGSNARSGYIGVSLSVLLLIMIMLKNSKLSAKKTIIIFFTLIALVFGLNYATKNKIFSRVNTLINDITGKNVENTEFKNFPLKTLEAKEDTLKVTIDNATIIFKIENGGIVLYDNNNVNIPYRYDGKTGNLVIDKDEYKDINISFARINDKNVIKTKKGMITVFGVIKDNKFYVADFKGDELNTATIEKWGFEGKERIGSSRGYIWSRTIPLLKNAIFKGYGPDTFAAYFPQHDIAGKYYAYYGDMWQLVDKPHNLYLQIAINTGVISLIVMLAMFLIYTIDSLRIYLKVNLDNFTSISGLAIFIGIIGYLGAGFFNDSVVSIAPVFWVLFGMGIAINTMVKKAMKVKKDPKLS